MRNVTYRWLLLAVLGSFLGACSVFGKGAPPVARAPTATHGPNTTNRQGTAVAVSTVPVDQQLPTYTSTPSPTTSTPSPETLIMPIALDRQQAEEVAVLMDFIRAYNAGQLDKSLSFFSDSGGWSDCDYRRGVAISGRGRSSVREWLHQNFRVHDHLEVSRVDVGREQKNALGVRYKRRTSDVLRSLGHPDGIEPQLGTKVIFSYSDSERSARIDGFNNGPIGGPDEACKVSSG